MAFLFVEVGHQSGGDPSGLGASHCGLGQGMVGGTFGSSQIFQQAIVIHARNGGQITQCQLAAGEGAGLVQQQYLQFGDGLQGRALFDQDAP